jgi:succinate dehydrogenase flavin-adding protein (antitoxin of CptAB toxin-antitoxin module)
VLKTQPIENLKTVIDNFMNDTLDNFKVTDRQTFIKFLAVLRNDLLDNPENWENKTLPDFLEALNTYTEDIQGYYDNMKLNVNADKPNWSLFADIFKGARIYE